MSWIIAISGIYCLVMAAAVTCASLPLLNILQLESYQGKMYLKWVWKHITTECVSYFAVGAVALLMKCAYAMLGRTAPGVASVCFTVADILYVALLGMLFFAYRKRESVKPLVYTARVKRFLVAEFIVALLFSAVFFAKRTIAGMSLAQFLFPLIIRYFPGMFLPVFLLIPFLLTYPVEWAVKRHYFNDAKRRLASHENLVRVGVTGSYGKTGTKYALATILSKGRRVLFTPGSFNTPMGVTRVVREQLGAEHEVFIAEMGARYKGDIKELTKLVGPEYGIITAVGKQHLETFGSLENIIKTKAELLAGIKPGGVCFLNADDENCMRIYNEIPSECEKLLFGSAGQGLYMRAADMSAGPGGSEFTLESADGKSIRCKTKLLGRHNVINITGAAALGYKLGMSLEDIAAAIGQMEGAEHRLQLIEGPVTVIDDAYNSNPVGSSEALDVLASFPGRHIVITPGMVELGAEEEELNREFGRHIAACADIAIIIGRKGIARADAICEGIEGAGFDADSLVRVESLAQATEELAKFTSPGCVVLFENDLPDNYL